MSLVRFGVLDRKVERFEGKIKIKNLEKKDEKRKDKNEKRYRGVFCRAVLRDRKGCDNDAQMCGWR